MRVSSWLVIVLSISLPLACITMVVILIGAQPSDRFLREKRPIESQTPLYLGSECNANYCRAQPKSA